MKWLRLSLGITLAFTAHLLMVRFSPAGGAAVNFLVIVLALYARRSSVGSAALVGGSLGWLADALVGSLYGLNGIAGTLAGAVCARVSQQVSYRQPALLGLVLAVMVVFQEVVVAALLRMLVPSPPAPDPAWVLMSALSTGVVGALLVVLLRRIEGSWGRYRRFRRPKVRLGSRRA